MNPRPSLYIPPASRPTLNGWVAKCAKTLALWVCLWAFGMGAPLILAAAMGRL